MNRIKLRPFQPTPDMLRTSLAARVYKWVLTMDGGFYGLYRSKEEAFSYVTTVLLAYMPDLIVDDESLDCENVPEDEEI